MDSCFFTIWAEIRKCRGPYRKSATLIGMKSTHLWLFTNILKELQKELPELFTEEKELQYRTMIREGCEQEIAWGHYVIGDTVSGLSCEMITDYVKYLGNLRCRNLGFDPVYEGYEKQNRRAWRWVSQFSNANMIKTDFFEAKSTAYAKSSALVDDL